MSEETSDQRNRENFTVKMPRIQIVNHLTVTLLITTTFVSYSFWHSHFGHKLFNIIHYPWNYVAAILTLICFIFIEGLILKLSIYKTRPQQTQESQESQNQNQNPQNPSSWKQCLKDFIDIASFYIGMGVQQALNPSLDDLLFVLSLMFWFIVIILIMKPRIDYGLIDIFIGLGTQFLVYLCQNKKYIWFIIGALICACLVIVRNRFDNLMHLASNNRFLRVRHITLPAPNDSSSTTTDIEQGPTERGPQRDQEVLRQLLLPGGDSSEIQPETEQNEES